MSKKKIEWIKLDFLLLIMLFAISITDVFAEDTKILRYGGSKNDYFEDMLIDGDSYIAVGRTASTDIKDFTNNGAFDGFIVKYQNDSIVWQKNYGEENSDSLNSIIKVDGGYIIVGYKNDSKTDTANNSKAVIIKINFNGEIEWEKEYLKNDGSKFTDVIENGEGKYVAIGESYDSDVVIPTLVTYDSNGNAGIEKEFVDYEDFRFTKILLTEDEGYVVIANYIYGAKPAIIKYDKTGNKIWVKEYDMEGKENAVFTDIILNSKGNYVVIGGNHFNATVSGLTDVDFPFILEYDKSGNQLSETIFNEYKQSVFSSIIEVEDGYLVIGSTANVDITDVASLASECFEGKIFKFNFDKKLDKTYNLSLKLSYKDSYNNLVDIALNDNYYLFLLNTSKEFLGTESNGADDGIILKYQKTLNEGTDVEDDIIIEEVEVPDTLSNSSVALIVIGVLLVAGGVIVYFVIINKRKNKE